MNLSGQFEKFITKHHLFSRKDKVLLAVSGGLDSVVMAELFHQSGFQFAIAHCNFQLRGKDADADEQFVTQLSKKYGVQVHTIRFETKKFASKHKLSVQEAARKLRYEWFDRLCSEKGYACIATAHNHNDSIETFFINLLRGTGIAGLAGITPSNEHRSHIRPLLFVTRNELEKFALGEGLKFRHDRSNDTDDYMRNRIRHHLIPLLQQLNPAFESVMQRNLGNLLFARVVFEEAILDKIFKMWLGRPGTRLDRRKLEKEPFAGELFSEFARQLGFNATQAYDIWKSKRSGAKVKAGKYVMSSDRNAIVLSVEKKPSFSRATVNKTRSKLPLPDAIVKFKKLPAVKRGAVSKDQCVHSLDYARLKFPLTLRLWKAGDAFQPLGMTGKKKISDFLTDRKVSLPDKAKTYVLLSGRNIVCVLGHRIDERYKVTENTKQVYQIEIDSNE